MSYTPGTWTAQERGAGVISDVRVEGNPRLLICEIVGQETTAESDANARLIAAAPDLLEACRGILARYLSLAGSGDCGFWNPEEESWVITVRAAIAKAEGR